MRLSFCQTFEYQLGRFVVTVDVKGHGSQVLIFLLRLQESSLDSNNDTMGDEAHEQ